MWWTVFPHLVFVTTQVYVTRQVHITFSRVAQVNIPPYIHGFFFCLFIFPKLLMFKCTSVCVSLLEHNLKYISSRHLQFFTINNAVYKTFRHIYDLSS